jgi:hypothetical protein
MRTQVLHLESYDDRHSIVDKIEWGQAERAILIWPLRGKPLANKLDLKLIHRRCTTAGMKVALVCRDPEIKEYAQGLDIPVFRSLRKAQQIAWEYTLLDVEKKKKPVRKFTRQELKEQLDTTTEPGWSDLPTTRISAVVLTALALLALVIFLVPSAHITYLPKLETQSLGITLQTGPSISGYNLSGMVTVETVTVSVEGRAEVNSSGSVGIADQAATGLIEFTNVTNQAVTIPAGTTVRTSNPSNSIRFVTSTDAVLEGQAGAKVSVPIEAVNPGSGSNLTENSLLVIDGSLALSLTATNPEPTSGGSERSASAPSLEDYDALNQELIGSLWENALAELENSLDQNDVILFEQPDNITISEESYTPEEPLPSETLSLLLRVDFDVLVIRWDILQAMGNAILDVTLPEGYSSQPDTLSVRGVNDPVRNDDGSITWEVLILRQIFTSENLPDVQDQIAGKSASQAAEIMVEHLELPVTPEIQIKPSWWPWLPWLKTRTTIVDLRGGE